MPALHKCRALLWAGFLAALLPSSVAMPHLQSQPRDLSMMSMDMSYTQDVYSKKLEADLPKDKPEEGEAHKKIKNSDAPDGAEFTSFKVNPDGDEEMAGYITKDFDKKTLEHLYIPIHGRLRDGDHYWHTLNNAIEKARKDDYHGSSGRQLAVLAPQFFSKKYNKGQYKKNQLAWDDLNAWQPGGRATHPEGTKLNSFDAIDGLIGWHADKDRYPNLKNITIVGHGGGGQLTQRYAAVGKDAPDHIHIRYVHGDASSCMYFTEDRPILEGATLAKGSKVSKDSTEKSKEDCPDYNKWRYGFDGFPASDMSKSAQDYFRQYVSRDVVSIVGYQDTGAGGDITCMANMQGGRNRRDRNLIWFRYVNTLAGTNEDLEGFPGAFDNVPDWSDEVKGQSHLRLVVVEHADHDIKKLFKGDLGRAVLFRDLDIEEGWRPDKGS